MWIDIGAQQTRVVAGVGQAPGATMELALGVVHTAERFFKHDPPSPHEIESAIDVVEDEVMRARAMVPRGSALIAEGAALREFGNTAGSAATDGVVTLEVVEQIFQRLASESLGNPMARQGFPAGNTFAATALILREFMHHLGFASVRFPAK